VVAGLFGAIALASPAQAHHAEVSGQAECQVDGKYAITWTVHNPKWDNPFMKIKSVVTDPAANSFAKITANTWLNAEESITEVQTVPGNTTKATLTVTSTWHLVKDGPVRVDTKTAIGEVKMPGKCTPVSATGEGTCTTFDVTVTNSAEGETVDATVTYGTQTVPVTLAKGESKKVNLTPSSQKEAKITFNGSDFTVTVPYNKPADCGGLPQTGSSTTTYIASGTGLAGLGVFVFFMARRRMAKLRRLAAE
jgi:LPXTG-motif cell wall-anchored protein